MLHLVYKLASSQPVEIRALTGETLTLDVPSSDRAGSVRAAAEEILGFGVGSHELCGPRGRLADDAALPVHAALRLIRKPHVREEPARGTPSLPQRLGASSSFASDRTR